MASMVYTLIRSYFSTIDVGENHELYIEVAQTVAHIGANIVYDSCIYLNNMNTASSGLKIMHEAYRRAKRKEVEGINAYVLHEYEHLYRTLRRPERTDLVPAQRLLDYYMSNREKFLIREDEMPEDLLDLVWEQADIAKVDRIKKPD